MAAPDPSPSAAAPPGGQPLKVFLSHSSPDKALARRLGRDLQSAGVAVWLDQWDIGVGERFEQRIAQGLADTDVVVVLLTRQAVASAWVNREWREAVAREAHTRRLAVLPVRAEPCELPDFLAQRSHASIAGGSYVPGFRHLLHLLQHHGDGRGVALAEAAAQADAQRRHTHLLAVERCLLGLPRPAQRLQRLLPVVLPIALELAADLIPLVAPDATGASRVLDERAPRLREALSQRHGFRFPGLAIRGNAEGLPEGQAVLFIDEVPQATLCLDRSDGEAALDTLFQALLALLSEQPQAFLHLDEVHRLASALPAEMLARTVPARLSWIDLTRVLQGLLEEGLGIGPLPTIVQALALCEPQRDSVDDAVEIARQALAGPLAARFLAGRAALPVLVAAPAVNALLLDALQPSPAGDLLALEPGPLEQLLAAVRQRMQALGDAAAGAVLLVADSRIRRHLRRLVMVAFPQLQVLSRQELPPDLALQPLACFGTAPEPA